METFVSDVSGKEFPVVERVRATSIRESLFKVIQMEHPNFSRESKLAISELNQYREKYVAEFLIKELDQVTALEQKVLDTINNSESLSSKLQDEDTRKLSIGVKVADKVASFGGSWTFILSFSAFIALWITVNTLLMRNKGFDPYPFILLNLILSCIAALQAPVIMMSQNRQEEKDRERAQNDYMINLKSELEIRTLHEKIDHLMIHQQQELIEIQKVQIEMLNDIITNFKKSED